MFEGIRGSGYRGDILIDDIKFVFGLCVGVVSCDFEFDFCGWI